jgi:hypothetical protein
MIYYINPDKKDIFAELMGSAQSMTEAKVNWMSMAAIIMDLGYDKTLFNCTGNKRMRKKKVKRMLYGTFLDKFVECLIIPNKSK